MFKRRTLYLMTVCCLAACETSQITHETGGAADSAANMAARDLIEGLGPQQTFARLGWQQNADYKPAGACFDAWSGAPGLEAPDLPDCDAHAADLSRLYASYGTIVDPIAFKSEHYWAGLQAFSLQFPGLVAAWEAEGGSDDDPSFLDHPVCAEPLQTGWEGSDYFYDGTEHPLCRLYKIDPVAAMQ